jgi:type II secretory pathway predicted ATPase ExeA
VGEDDILRLINAAFGLQHEHLSKAALLRNLEAFFRARQAEGKRVLIVVDEAQNLPPRTIEELRMLSNYQDEQGRALVQSFLLGQAELKDTLQQDEMEQVRQRIIAAHHLAPLGQDELKRYVEHRLECVGWQGRPRITDDAYASWHQASGGVPRRINTLGDRILLYGALEEHDLIDADQVQAVVDEVASELGGNAAATPRQRPKRSYDGGVDERVIALEADVAALREKVRKQSRLLKKLLMLEMERDEDRG